MKKLLTSVLLIVAAVSAISLSSCKKKPKDADIKAAVETALKADPMAANTSVSVTNGVATISGECKDDMCKAHCGDLVKGIKGVKEVVNNCTVAPPVVAPLTTDSAVDALSKSVNDALKDYPGVTGAVNNQVLTLSGEIAKDKLQKLMMSLNSLKSMGLKSIDSKSLVKK
jgi:hyperosmotically inducible periplasmic protein